MEACNVSAMYLKPRVYRSNFCNHVTLDTRELTRLTQSCVDNGVTLRCHVSTMYPTHKLCNFVLSENFGLGANSFRAHHGHYQTSRTVPHTQASRSHSLISCKVTKDSSGGSLSGESILQNEQTLERELQIAIEEENYSQAAKIRDSLKLLHEDSKASVLSANSRFYNSFRNGDLAAMQTLWSKGEHVCVVHPGVSGISGYDLVMGSWEFVWADYEFPLEIEVKDIQVHVRGDVGYVTGIEMVRTKGSGWGRHFVTNVFERVDGQWFMCIHHASYVDL